MTTLKWPASFSLAIVTLPAIYAESHCPGNVTSLRLRFIQRSLIVVPVKINHTGSYDFMVNTGAQVTTADPALASALHIKVLGEAGFTGVGLHSRTLFAQLDSLQAGSHVVDRVLAVIQDPGQVQTTDPHVRGILGSNFLEHFDVLIDYPHSVLCPEEGKLVQANVKGAHIALARAPHPERGLPFTELPMIVVRVSGIKTQLLLERDSGSNALYERGKELAHMPFVSAPLRTRGADGIEHEFAALPPQEVQVGTHVLAAFLL